MSLREQVVSALEQGREDERDFMASLPDNERCAEGTYEKWSAKDSLAHMAYWQEERAKRLTAMALRQEAPPTPGGFEGTNAACFQRFCKCSWDEIEAYAELALTQLIDAVRSLEEKALVVPAPGSGENALWRDIVNTGYTHSLVHIAECYIAQGQAAKAGKLWADWGLRVAPLDGNADWQGSTRYNVACGLALAGNPQQALSELREALRLRPSLTSWSRRDSDLISLQVLPEYRELYAPAFWWKAMEAGPQAEALADQFVRTLWMLREAIQAFPAEEWRKGDTPYQRPAGLALHVLASARDYCALKPGDAEPADRFADWEGKDSSKLPSQADMLAYQHEVAQRLAHFLTEADLMAAETQFRWTGSTLLGRAAYVLRHTQHHLAEMCLELHRRGLRAPQWQ